jgi:hypothetical protein
MPGSSPDTPQEAEVLDNQVEATEDVNTAGSSTADEKGSPASMLDAVKTALDIGDQEKTPVSETEGSKAEVVASDEKPADEADFTEDELKSYKPKTQERIRRLVGKIHDAKSEADSLRPKADGFERISAFVRDKGLSEQDVNTGFEIMALMSSDPVRAYQVLTPIYQQLAANVGAVLPQDLADDVRLGYVSQNRAQELAQTRALADIERNRAQRFVEQRQQEEIGRQNQAHIDGVAGAVTTWEKAKSANDPDWELKRERIGELIELEVRRAGYPQNPQQAVELAEKALMRVSQELKKFAPRATSVTPVTGAASGRSQAQPQNMLEAIKRAVGS